MCVRVCRCVFVCIGVLLCVFQSQNCFQLFSEMWHYILRPLSSKLYGAYSKVQVSEYLDSTIIFLPDASHFFSFFTVGAKLHNSF